MIKFSLKVSAAIVLLLSANVMGVVIPTGLSDDDSTVSTNTAPLAVPSSVPDDLIFFAPSGRTGQLAELILSVLIQQKNPLLDLNIDRVPSDRELALERLTMPKPAVCAQSQ